MHPFLNTATTAARKAGNIIARAMQDLGALDIQEKGRHDYVTNIDHQAEKVIIDIIQKAYPSHGILAEESGEQSGDEYQWIIDPLDGTKNFVHGLPHCCVSMAVMHKGRIEHGLIYDPFRDDLFTATRGNGARLNNYRIRVSNLPNLRNALVSSTLLPNNPDFFAAQTDLLQSINQDISGVRMMGSAALSLAYVAAGRLDAYWEVNLKPWDMAAGALMVREAGGLVTDMKGSEDFLDNGKIVAGNLKIVRQLLPKLKSF